MKEASFPVKKNDPQKTPVNDSALQKVDELDAQRPVGKFLYRSGSRPLEGYTIKRGVGQGGFGEIYYALSDAGKEVALKLIRRNLEVELRGIRQCLNLKHPNLIDLYDIRQDGEEKTWVVMEYMSGVCLQDALETYPEGLPEKEALAWIHGIGEAVAYLHEHGIVHRDLKPGNVFSNEGVMKVGDYGLSKYISCGHRSGQTESIGTVHYIAPEVANGRYGKEIDIYALGVMLYEMLTGGVPFEGESVGEILMKHLTVTPDVSRFAEPYRTVLKRALEKDPEKRYGSVAEFLAALPPPEHGLPGSGRLPLNYEAKGRVYSAEVVEREDEPVLRRVKQGWANMLDSWNKMEMNSSMKALLLSIVLLMLVLNFGAIIPLAFLLLILYGFYRMVRFFVLALDSVKTSPLRPGVGGLGNPVEVKVVKPVLDGELRKKGRRGQEPVSALVLDSGRERTIELLGSMLLSSAIAACMMVVLILLNGFYEIKTEPTHVAWLYLVSVVGAWSILIASKLWEGWNDEPMVRRFVMLFVGFGLGAFAYWLAGWMMVSLATGPRLGVLRVFNIHLFDSPVGFYRYDGEPLLPAYLVVFGSVFGLIRWWRQADLLKRSRLRFGGVLKTIVVALFVAGFWQFPQLWMAMIAGTMSVAVQLSTRQVDLRAAKGNKNEACLNGQE